MIDLAAVSTEGAKTGGAMSPVVLSFGGGVQSSCLLLMAEEGLVMPRPTEAVFADTGWEPPAVYAHIEAMRARTTIPISVVSAGNLRTRALDHKGVWMPLYVQSEGQRGMVRKGMLRRQCTSVYKINPIRRHLRERMRSWAVTSIDLWYGISWDEVQRMRTSDVRYVTNVYPLVEQRLDRAACAAFLADRGIVAPKSACVGCPYHSDAMWREMRDERPGEWADAVAFDAAVRDRRAGHGQLYLHRQRVPLAEVDLQPPLTPEERGQLSLAFGDECWGVCGV